MNSSLSVAVHGEANLKLVWSSETCGVTNTAKYNNPYYGMLVIIPIDEVWVVPTTMMDKEKSRCNTVDAKDEYDKWPYKTWPNKTRRWNKIQRTTAVTSELSTVSSITSFKPIVYMAGLVAVVAMAYVGLVLYCRHGRIHRRKNWIIHQLCCNLKDAVVSPCVINAWRI